MAPLNSANNLPHMPSLAGPQVLEGQQRQDIDTTLLQSRQPSEKGVGLR